ncbi:MAG: VOC family protein [Gammaproteobacteria bacterium]|nr:VOC family protein [Gammaproteobacteria bacterium]
MSEKRPPATAGLRHVALYCSDLDAMEHFYVELMGMAVEWRPDPDNVYLSSGNDNLALHRGDANYSDAQRLDHIGFIIEHEADVDTWHAFLVDQGVSMRTKPKTHRDGARSFYCEDPDGNVVQIIYHPPLVGTSGLSPKG